RRSLLAAKSSEKLAFRGINPQAGIMRIADEKIAILVDAQSAGPAIAIIGRGPHMVQEMAVAVEHLDARGPIDEIESVLSIDGGSPGLDQLPSLDTAFAPHQFRLIAFIATSNRKQTARGANKEPSLGGQPATPPCHQRHFPASAG